MNNQESQIEHINYEESYFKPFRRKLLLFVIFMIIIVSSLPVKTTLDRIIYSSLNINSRCSIGLKSYGFEWFSPKLALKGISIPKSCNYNLPSNIKLDYANLYIRGLSFSPLGLSFKLSTEILGNKLEAFIIPSFTNISVLLESPSRNGKFLGQENSFNLKSLSKFIPLVSLSGDITISTLFLQLGYDGSIKDLAFNLASKNFKVPTQSIVGFKLEQIQINSILLQATQTAKNKIKINKFTLGDEKSPLISNFTGDLKLNQRYLKSSKVNLKGELAVGKELTSQIFIIDSFLKRFDKKGKFYQIKIDGPISKPTLTSAR
jgi:hypothetical protein